MNNINNSFGSSFGRCSRKNVFLKINVLKVAVKNVLFAVKIFEKSNKELHFLVKLQTKPGTITEK